MKTYQLKNQTTGEILLEELALAQTFRRRFMGLMGKTIRSSEGLWIKPCSSIHCFFMKMPIDVLFLDAEHKVLRQIGSMKPWTISPIVRGAHSVIEGPAGSFQGVSPGDEMIISN